MRLTIVQYAGDYRETWERFERGGKATYQAQRYSVNLVGRLAERLEQAAVVCAVTEESYDVILSNRVRAVGGGLGPGFKARDLISIVESTAPDRLLLTTPIVPLLKWARRKRIRTIAALADSFQGGGLRNRINDRLLARELNDPNVEWVGNHGIGACLSLVDIGVRAEKVIPWDWPPSYRPTDHSPRTLASGKQLKLVYVGAVEETKGVGDLLRALERLKRDAECPHLTIIGRDREGSMATLASRIGLEGQVQFTGIMANEDVPGAMREADVVVIPSRHEYPEGLPLTIYEALAVRTPIIASDHPMFRGALIHERSALTFPAGDVGALASAIRRLAADSSLYATLSSNSADAWDLLQLPVSWGDLLEHWLSGLDADKDWLAAHSLKSGLYASQIELRRVT